ncbi:MAG: glycosyltransferase [Bacillota bacterium]|nr:glycosyltransferase [Bacillota bacterium]
MTGPQVVYCCAVVVYLIFFVLFARFFVWKYLADRDYWGRRPVLTAHALQSLAHQQGRDLPRFSVLVPARNEAAVIEKTVEHLTRMDYPKTHYEVVVATDQKEVIEAARTRPAAVAEVESLLRQRLDPDAAAGRPAPARPLGPEAARLLTHLLAEQALREYNSGRSRYPVLVVPSGLAWVPHAKRPGLLRDIAALLIAGRGRLTERQLCCVVERTVPARPAEQLRREGPALVGLAIPVLAAFHDLSGNGGRRMVPNMLRRAARAKHRATAQILVSLVRLLSATMVDSLARQSPADLRSRLELAAIEALPTTQDVVDRTICGLGGRGTGARVKHIVVPYDFDGRFGGRRTGASVPSTKGRALNYALVHVDPLTEVCGFYDAESRPDPPVLLYVAWRRLVAGTKVMQGPVFQVRNFFQMGPLCRIASLYQAVTHEWYLPHLFRRLPFVSGTNLYVEKVLLQELGGYDHGSLTEDLELGVRAYLRAGEWPEYLPYASSEQTPPTLRGFFRQRLRWGTGHLQVMDKLRADNTSDPVRRRKLLHHLFVKGQMEWSLYQLATLVPPAVVVLYFMGWVDPYGLPVAVHRFLSALTLVYWGFTMYVYVRYHGYLDMSARPRNRFGHWSVLPQLLILPLAAFMFPVPYSAAMVLKGLGREPKAWVKTPRTVE